MKGEARCRCKHEHGVRYEHGTKCEHHQENVEALILPDWSDHVVVDRGVLFKA